MKGEERVLILAVVTELHDNHISYPSCRLCYTKLLVDPISSRYEYFYSQIYIDSGKTLAVV